VEPSETFLEINDLRGLHDYLSPAPAASSASTVIIVPSPGASNTPQVNDQEVSSFQSTQHRFCSKAGPVGARFEE
jgi:hypothetical protein